MARTWTLMIGLAVLWGSVCTGMEGYTAMAPAGIEVTGLGLTGDFSGLIMGPGGGDGAWLAPTLEGVQANLSIFEQSDGLSGLPMNLCPYWGNLPEVAQIQTGMGLKPPAQMITSINVAEGLPGIAGQSGNVAVPLSGFTTDSFGAIQMPNSLIGNP